MLIRMKLIKNAGKARKILEIHDRSFYITYLKILNKKNEDELCIFNKAGYTTRHKSRAVGQGQ